MVAVRDAVVEVDIGLYAGKLQPRVRTGLAPLMILHLRAIGTSDVKEQVAIVEKRLAADGSEGRQGLTCPESHKPCCFYYGYNATNNGSQ